MLALENLPLEILTQIISYIDGLEYESSYHVDLNDRIDLLRARNLANVSLVSRLFRNVSEPFLYQSVAIGWHYSRLRRSTPWTFLRSVLYRPSLGAHVKTLNVDWVGGREEVEEVEDWPEDPTALAPVEKTASEVGLFVAAARKTQLTLSPQSHGDQIILLLHLLPRLNSLGTLPPFHGDNFEKFLSTSASLALLPASPSASPLAVGLKNLRNFVHAHYSSESDNHITRLLPAFALPSIRSIETYEIHRRNFGGERLEAPNFKQYHGSSVTELIFLNSSISWDFLVGMFSIATAVTHFKYAYSRSGSYSSNGYEFRKILGMIKQSLQYLKLHLRFDGFDRTIGSLTDFPVLRIVSCDLATLAGTTGLIGVLPPTIEKLTLRFHWGNIYGEELGNLVEFLEQKKQKFPGLQLVKLRGAWGQPGSKNVETLRATSRAPGLRLILSGGTQKSDKWRLIA